MSAWGKRLVILGTLMACLGVLGPAALGTALGGPAAGGLIVPGSALAAGVDDADDVEEIDPVVVVSAAPNRAAGSSWSRWGKLHPLMTHLPIGWLMLLVLIELLAFRRPSLDALALPLGYLTLGVFVPAMITGFMRADAMADGGASGVLDHRNGMLLAVAFLALAVAWRWFRRRNVQGVVRGLYLLLLLAAGGATTVGGHLGAKLVFGAGYWPF